MEELLLEEHRLYKQILAQKTIVDGLRTKLAEGHYSKELDNSFIEERKNLEWLRDQKEKIRKLIWKLKRSKIKYK